MAHDLSNCIQLQAGALDMFRPLSLDIGAEAGEDRFIQGSEIVPGHRLAGRDGDVVPAGARRGRRGARRNSGASRRCFPNSRRKSRGW